MIVLTVISFNGSAVSISPVSFDEIGGTIGRADSNQLVLPDIERTVSRVHAQIAFRAGRYALVDRGSNPVLHNGQPIGNGREVLLVSGDEIQIGGYLIKVSSTASVKSDDPFAEFDAESSIPPSPVAGQPKLQAIASKAAEPVRSANVSGRPFQSPSEGIPDDWDPFRPDPPGLTTNPGSKMGGNQASRPVEPATPVFGVSQPTSVAPSTDSLDDLFGLIPGSAKGDPLAGSSLQASQNQANTASNADPMRALLNGSAPVVVASHDHDSDLQTPWKDMPVQPQGKPVSSKKAALPGAVLSWDRAEKESPALPRSMREGPAATASNLAANNASGKGGLDDNQELLQAFLNGLGAPSLRMQPLNADAMFQLGQLLRESTQGTVDLLAARTALKKEVRAAVTVMVSTSNNALKFSPTVEFALQYLLGPPTAGFMGPLESMRDAFDDLKAHQLGVMAGMRAVLSDVLKRFDPAVLEDKLVSRGNAFSLMPSGKKARLWELFQELFTQLAQEAQEDFDELFGKAFVREYERYIAELNVGKTP